MKRNDRFAHAAFLALAGAVALFAAEPAYAAGGGGGKFLGAPTWVWQVLNLLVFFGGIFYLVRKPIGNFFTQRSAQIAHDLAEATERRGEAANIQTTLGAKVAELEAEIARIEGRAETDGRREREEIVAQATRERDRLLAQAQAEIEHRLAKAKQELTAYTASLAAQLARQELAQRVGPAERARLLADNLARLEKEAVS